LSILPEFGEMFHRKVKPISCGTGCKAA